MGWGDFSSEASFSTYDYPGTPTGVTTAYNNMNIKISWTAPATNYKPILEYKILIKDTTMTTYHEQTTYC
jgi:hypothetical protein